MRLKDVDQTRKALGRLTRSDEDAQSIQTVCVTLPVPALQSTGLRIVDTPGTDATALWHEEVTIRAIEELSDLSIILVNGTKPLPESFCDFIEENLGRVLERCVFVVTKLDLVPPQERSRMLEYIGMKLRNTLDIEEPVVLPFYSAEIIGTFAPNDFAKGDQQMVALSQRTEKFIRKHSAVWRNRIQSQRKQILFEQIYTGLANHMLALSDDLRQRLELLEKSRSVDLEAFMKEQKLEKVKALYMDAQVHKEELCQVLDKHTDQIIGGLIGRVSQFQRVDHIHQFMRSELIQVCHQASQYQDKLAMTHYGRVGNLRDEKMRQFREDFRKLYEGLDVLNVQLPYIPRCLPAPVPLPNLQNAFGAVAGGRLDLVKQSVMQQMVPALRAYFAQLRGGFLNSYDRFTQTNHQLLLQEMHQYRVAYRDEVNKRIEQEEKNKQELEERMAALEVDRKSLLQRQSALMDQQNTVA
jgi:hypothetical protein